MNKFVLTVYIGRFSPFHDGHAEVLNRAFNSSTAVAVLIGSVDRSRSPKNPWNFAERSQMIMDWVETNRPSSKLNIQIRKIRDYPYNDQLWIANTQNVINGLIVDLMNERGIERKEIVVRITGSDRDSSTFYLKYFPEYELDLVDELEDVSKFLTATNVREIYFGQTFNGKGLDDCETELLTRSFLPRSTTSFLEKFKNSATDGEIYTNLRDEHLFNVEYRKPYLSLPYETIFHTVDSLVVQTGYVLLVERRSRPGKGLWALPGGFLNPKERLLNASIRELREETKIKVPDAVLRGSLKLDKNFDYPDRSLRGRTITTAFVYQLPDFVKEGKIELPQVKGSDDAKRAWWCPLDTALQNPEQFFEDHFDIIETLVSKL